MALAHKIFKLASARAAGQVIAFAIAPVISRLYTPGDYGTFHLFASILSILLVIACLRYDASIPMGKNDQEASASLLLSAGLATAFSLLIFAAMPWLNVYAVRWFDSEELGCLLWLLPLVLLIESWSGILHSWGVYKAQFGLVALITLAGSVIGTLIPIVWFFAYGPSATGLLARVLIGSSIIVVLFLFFLFKPISSSIKGGGVQLLGPVAREYRQFPLYNTWTGLTQVVSRQFLPIILGIYFSKEVVGNYALGYSFVSVPLVLIGNSIGQTFYPEAAKIYRSTGSLLVIVQDVFKTLLLIGIFPTMIFALLGQSIMTTVFGQQWVEAGAYTQILVFWSLFVFIHSPLSYVFPILNRQAAGLVSSIIMSFRIVAVAVGTYFFSDPKWALGLFVVLSVLTIFGRILFILKISGVSLLWALKIVFRYAVFAVAVILPINLLFLIVSIDLVLIQLFVSTIVYAVVLYLVESDVKKAVDRMSQEMRLMRMPFHKML